MQIPLQITFHDLPPSPALDDEVRRRVDELGHTFDRSVSCRVLIDAPHRHHQQGRRYRVRVDLAVPGRTIVAARSPEEDASHEDVRVAVRDAFDAVERRLADFVQRRRGEVKTHQPA